MRKLTKFALPVLLLTVCGYMIYAVPPMTPEIIFLFIFCSSLFLFLILSLLTNKKTGLTIALFLTSFLLINYFASFSPLNTVLLIFLFVGVMFLVK